MDWTPDQIFRSYFTELEHHDIPHVVLHSYQEFPEVIHSDVDYAVHDGDLNRAYKILQAVAANGGYKVVQTLQYDIAAFYTVLVNPNHPGRFIKMDRSSHYTRNGCSFIDVEILLEGRRKYKGFFVPAPSSEFIYTLAKAFAKSKDINRFIPYLKELWQAEPERSEQLFAEVFGADQGRLQIWFNRPAVEWLQLSAPMHARNRFGPAQRLRELHRRLHRFLQPTGLRVTVLGPDGVGKSAVISRLQTLLDPCFRRQEIIHFSPFLLRKRNSAVVSEPHARPARSTVASWGKVIYYFLDHWLGYLLQQRLAIAKSTCLYFDRDFNDLLIDPTRYRIRNSAPLVRILSHLLPPVELTFVLDAQPETVHKRKRELSIAELERQQGLLRNMAEASGNWIVISAEPGPEEVARAIWSNIVEHLAKREDIRYKPNRR